MTREKAIKIVKEFINGTCLHLVDQEALETLIPELYESEDERIRQAIVELVKWVKEQQIHTDHFDNGIKWDEMIVYLEKQKERGPLTKEEEYILHHIIEYLEDETCPSEWIYLLHDIYCLPYANQKEQEVDIDKLRRDIYQSGYNDGYRHGKEDAQKEQKPKKRPKFKIGDIVKFKGFGDEPADDTPLKIVGYDNELYLFDNGTTDLFSEQNLYELVEQKPAEWSEEDERNLIRLCRIIHSRVVNKELSLAEESELGKWMDKWLNHEPQPVQKWDEFDEDCLKRAIWYVENPAPSVVKDTNLALWLKSLPERFSLQPKLKSLRPQQQGVYKLIVHNIYAMLKDKDFMASNHHWMAHLLNDIRVRCKNADEEAEILTQPHWKPSEEQMKELELIINGKTVIRTDFIRTLYNDLKKLM